MNTIKVCEKVLLDGCQLVRRRKENATDAEGNKLPDYDIKDAFTGKKKGWFYLDLYSASAVMACYKALNPENQAKAPRLSISQWIEFAFQHVK